MNTKYEIREDLSELKSGLNDNCYSVRESIREVHYDLKNDNQKRDFKVQEKLREMEGEIRNVKWEVINKMYSLVFTGMVYIYFLLLMVVIILY